MSSAVLDVLTCCAPEIEGAHGSKAVMVRQGCCTLCANTASLLVNVWGLETLFGRV